MSVIQTKHSATLSDKVGWIVLVLFWVLVIIVYLQMPDVVPTHFNAVGKADDYGSKASLFTLPIVGTCIFIGIAFLKKFPHRLNYLHPVTPQNAAEQYRKAVCFLTVLQYVVLILFSAIVCGVYFAVHTSSNSIG